MLNNKKYVILIFEYTGSSLTSNLGLKPYEEHISPGPIYTPVKFGTESIASIFLLPL